MFLPVSPDFKYSCLIAFKLSLELRFSVRVCARARELKRLKSEKRALEQRFQDIACRISVEHISMAGRMVDPRYAYTRRLQDIFFGEGFNIGKLSE